MKIGKYIRLSVFGYRLSGHHFRTPNTEHRTPKKGFTLVELLIATTIFAVVSVVIYSTFSSGMSVWRRLGKTNIEGIKNLIKIERINRELRQAFFLQDRLGKYLVFRWNKHTIGFRVIIDSEVNRVIYEFDENKKMLLKNSDKMKDIIIAEKKGEEWKPKFIPYLDAVNDLSFSFYYFDLYKGVYVWKNEWEENVPPLAVRLNLTVENENYNSTIFFPCS